MATKTGNLEVIGTGSIKFKSRTDPSALSAVFTDVAPPAPVCGPPPPADVINISSTLVGDALRPRYLITVDWVISNGVRGRKATWELTY